MHSPNSTLRAWRIGGGIAGVLILLAMLVAANLIFGVFRLRADLTQERLYTLSPGTRAVLADLRHPVTLQFFFNGSEPSLPGPLKNFAAQVRDLLGEYEKAGAGKIVMEPYDPAPDSDAADLAESQGVAGQPINAEGAMLYLGIAAVCGDQHAAIPVVDPRAEAMLEYNITRLIQNVAQPEKPVVGVLSTLPVLGAPSGLPPMMGGPPKGQEKTWAAFGDLRELYNLRQVPVSAETIAPEIKTLIVVHPKELSERTLYAIDQFVLRGGRLIACLDPFCTVDPGAGDQMAMMGGGGGRSSTLGKLLPAWGVHFDTDKIVADIEAATPVRGRDQQVVESPLYLSLRADNLNPKEIATASLESMMMVYAGSFTVDEKKGLTATPLIHSSARSSLTDTMAAQFDPKAGLRDYKRTDKQQWLAVRIEGHFTTAFPDGQPAARNADGSAQTNAAATVKGLAESVTNGTVVLVGDVDCLANPYTVQEMDFMGISQPVNNNIAFFGNLVDQLNGGPALIAIRSRGRTQRPFSRVLAMQNTATERWIEQEKALEEKLQATQQHIKELQTRKDDKQRLTLNPRQQQAIEGFRQEVVNTRKQLKDVRRNLREDIEALGMRIKLINILAIPLLIAGFGIAGLLLRRNRAKG